MTETAETTFTLQGEWQVHVIGQRRSSLSSALDSLTHPGGNRPPVRIDLCGVSTVDACGWQLLLLFAQTLTELGFTPLPCGISPPLREGMAALGFAPAFAALERDAEGAP